MSLNPELHKLLVSRQSMAELERKRDRAWRRSFFTQEDRDYAERYGFIVSLHFKGVLTTPQPQTAVGNTNDGA